MAHEDMTPSEFMDDAVDKVGDEVDCTDAKDGGIIKKILVPGEGIDTPEKGADVRAHYTGRLLDGTVFDSSVERGEPFKFKIGQGQVIKGWDQGIAKMKLNEKAILTCKPEYAYGAQGSPPKIPPNSTLAFEVELLSWTSDIDVTSDGGVIKKIVKEGSGWDTPSEDAHATVNYIAKVNGAQVDSKTDFRVLIGAEEVSTGLEKAIISMKKYEKAIVTIKSPYNAGAASTPSYAATEGAVVQYEIEVTDFEKEKKSYEMDFQEKYDTANRYRNEGNDLFKAGKLVRAARKYKKAVDFFQHESSLKGDEEKRKAKEVKLPCYLNLAAVDLKEKKYKECKEHCDKALEIDSNNVKALFRRACVYSDQDNFIEARRDLERALDNDPNNKDTKAELARLKKKEADQNKKDRAVYGGIFEKLAKKETERERRLEEEQRNKRSNKPADETTNDQIPEPMNVDSSDSAQKSE